MALKDSAMAGSSTGTIHSLAVTARGAVWSWGEVGSHGRLGHGDVEEQPRPKHIMALKERLVAVSAAAAVGAGAGDLEFGVGAKPVARGVTRGALSVT